MNAKSPASFRLVLMRLVPVIVAVLGVTLSAHAAATAPTNFTGKYDLVNPKLGRTFVLDVKQTKSRADVSFVVTMTNSPGGTEGSGKGEMEDGVLSFDFKDQVRNEGTGTLSFANGNYTLSLTVLKVADISTLHFYGNVVLKKASETLRHHLSTEKM